MDEEVASVETRALYQDVKQTLDLPIVNSAYQAMAKWPGFLFLAWKDVKTQCAGPEFLSLEADLARLADEAASRLSPAVEINPAEIHDLLNQPEEENNLRQMVALFTRLLPSLIVHVAMFRYGAAGGAFTPAPRSEPQTETPP